MSFIIGMRLQRLYIYFEYVSGKFYGPVYHTTTDAVLLTIMKGRDYGLPDYNTVRKTMGLEEKTSFEEINPQLNRTNPDVGYSICIVFKYCFPIDKLRCLHDITL